MCQFIPDIVAVKLWVSLHLVHETCISKPCTLLWHFPLEITKNATYVNSLSVTLKQSRAAAASLGLAGSSQGLPCNSGKLLSSTFKSRVIFKDADYHYLSFHTVSLLKYVLKCFLAIHIRHLQSPGPGHPSQ